MLWHGTELKNMEKIIADGYLRPQLFYKNHWSTHPTGEVLFLAPSHRGTTYDVYFGVQETYWKGYKGSSTTHGDEFYVYEPIPLGDCTVKVWKDLFLFWYQGPEGPAFADFKRFCGSHIHSHIEDRIYHEAPPCVIAWLEKNGTPL